MCATCEAMEELAGQGLLVCGSCGSEYDLRCSAGHWYCRCAEPMERYDGGGSTPCFRCATGI